METVGFVGVGKIGLPISENLIKSGYRVLGYRRGSLDEFEKVGGVPAKSPAEIGAQADIVFSCLPSSDALDEVVQGPQGLAASARPGQIVIELGSHPVPDKERQIAPLAAKGAVFLDGEVSGTPGMVSARKAVIYLAGDAEGREEGRAGGRRLRRFLPVLRQVRRGEPGQARQQSAGRDQHRGHRRGDGARAEGRRRRRPDDQGDRHRQRRLDPVRASARPGWRSGASCRRRARCRRLQHYFDMIGDFADDVGVATPLLDRAVELYDKFIEMGFAEKDGAAMVDVIAALPRAKKS